jgi:hypothetical protein
MGGVLTVVILSIVGVESIASIGITAFVGIGVVLYITIVSSQLIGDKVLYQLSSPLVAGKSSNCCHPFVIVRDKTVVKEKQTANIGTMKVFILWKATWKQLK